jgi:membrane protein implicated in regulation of membrane protease activity
MLDNLPFKVLLSLDLVNMFKNMSRRQCCNILRRDFPELLTVFDNMYQKATKLWMTLPDGTAHVLLMIEEGFSQGCALSSLFAALILYEILQDVKQEHDTRQVGNNRVKGKGGPEIMPIAFMDDTNVLLHIDDVEWFLKQVTTLTLGAPVGVFIGKAKSKILN